MEIVVKFVRGCIFFLLCVVMLLLMDVDCVIVGVEDICLLKVESFFLGYVVDFLGLFLRKKFV